MFKSSIAATAAGVITGLTLSVASSGFAQDVNPAQRMPPPLVTAGIPAPAHSVEWGHYDIVEKCTAAFQRVLVPISLPIARDTLRDTARHDNPWLPLAPDAIQVGQACLQRLQIAKLPVLAFPAAFRLAVALNDDALVQTLVTRRLALAKNKAARAAVLDSIIEVLMSNTWERINSERHLTAAHIQLAHTYVAQLDALGAVAIRQRVGVRRDHTIAPAQYANDIDALLTLARETQQVFQHVPVDSLPQDSIALRRWYTGSRMLNDIRIHELQYVTTFSHTDLAAFVNARLDFLKFLSGSNDVKAGDIVGETAPPVTADYWFNTPAAGPPHSLPTSGTISVILFGSVGSGFPYSDEETARVLRRLHQEIPDVEMTVLVQAGGVFGDQLLTDHPAQLAAQIRTMVSDSLRLPGFVGVTQMQMQTLPNGTVAGIPTALWQSYAGPIPNTIAVVDPTGMVVYEGNDAKPFGDDLVDFVRRLHAKFAAAPNNASR